MISHGFGLPADGATPRMSIRHSATASEMHSNGPLLPPADGVSLQILKILSFMASAKHSRRFLLQGEQSVETTKFFLSKLASKFSPICSTGHSFGAAGRAGGCSTWSAVSSEFGIFLFLSAALGLGDLPETFLLRSFFLFYLGRDCLACPPWHRSRLSGSDPESVSSQEGAQISLEELIVSICCLRRFQENCVNFLESETRVTVWNLLVDCWICKVSDCWLDLTFFLWQQSLCKLKILGLALLCCYKIQNKCITSAKIYLSKLLFIWKKHYTTNLFEKSYFGQVLEIKIFSIYLVATFVHLLLYKLAVIIYLTQTRMQIRPNFQPNAALWRSVCVFPFLRHIGHTRSKHFGEGCAGKFMWHIAIAMILRRQSAKRRKWPSFIPFLRRCAFPCRWLTCKLSFIKDRRRHSN